MLIALKMMHFNKKCAVNENMKKNWSINFMQRHDVLPQP